MHNEFEKKEASRCLWAGTLQSRMQRTPRQAQTPFRPRDRFSIYKRMQALQNGNEKPNGQKGQMFGTVKQVRYR